MKTTIKQKIAKMTGNEIIIMNLMDIFSIKTSLEVLIEQHIGSVQNIIEVMETRINLVEGNISNTANSYLLDDYLRDNRNLLEAIKCKEAKRMKNRVLPDNVVELKKEMLKSF